MLKVHSEKGEVTDVNEKRRGNDQGESENLESCDLSRFHVKTYRGIGMDTRDNH